MTRPTLLHETLGPTERQQAARDFATKYLVDDREAVEAFAELLVERDRTLREALEHAADVLYEAAANAADRTAAVPHDPVSVAVLAAAERRAREALVGA